MTATGDELAARAAQAARAGRMEEAAALWRQALAVDPNNSQALFHEGRRRVEQGDAATAASLFSRAEIADKSNADIPLYLALAQKMQGDIPGALRTIDRALALDPYSFVALLSKGSLLESMAQPRQAARVYRDAVKIAPPPVAVAPAQRGALEHAREVVEANARALADHLQAATKSTRARYAGERLERFDECLQILAGIQTPKPQEPTLHTWTLSSRWCRGQGRIWN